MHGEAFVARSPTLARLFGPRLGLHGVVKHAEKEPQRRGLLRNRIVA